MTRPAPRTPNFTAFILTGAVIGLVIGLFFGARDPGGPSYVPSMNYSNTTAMAYLGAVGAFLGAGVGAIVAILLDRTGRSDR